MADEETLVDATSGTTFPPSNLEGESESTNNIDFNIDYVSSESKKVTSFNIKILKDYLGF